MRFNSIIIHVKIFNNECLLLCIDDLELGIMSNIVTFEEDLTLEDIGILPFNISGFWETPNTCIAYSMLLNPGIYIIEAWGASGGSSKAKLKSAGGYSRGKLILTTQTRLFVVAGDVGETVSSKGYRARGGCNGGGSGIAESSSTMSGGGGASHVSALKNDLSYRILVAGGSGGSDPSSKGGEGGGQSGKDGYKKENGFTGNGQGATQLRPGLGCGAGTDCTPGSFGKGGNARGTDPGCGGGGGWWGGAASDAGGVGAGGGSGFVFDGQKGTGCNEIDNHPMIGNLLPIEDRVTEVGKNFGKGRVLIQALEVITATSICMKPSEGIRCKSRTIHLEIILFAMMITAV